MKNYCFNRWLVLLGALVLGGVGLHAQSVIFPQEQQAGSASLMEDNGEYTLSNDLFSVTFNKADGKLMFGGSANLFLLPGDELFSITLGDGTVVPASQMTLGEVRVSTLTGNASAVRASEKLDGMALEADYTYGDLSIAWKAILRNGSHYLRTSLDLTANGEDVAMKNIKPMIYTVDNLTAGSAPIVVGNTRGAVLASDKIFAGLETPMGNNIVATTSDVPDFVYNQWTKKADSDKAFTWLPGDETPAGILALDGAFTAQDIVGYRGAVAFKETGEQTITFEYTSGNHKLDIVGVDIVRDGAVVSSDYHKGYATSSPTDNVYTINVPEKGAYLVRYFVETKTESVHSAGNILYSKKVKAANVVFGADPNKAEASMQAAEASAPVSRVLAAGTEISVGIAELTDTWVESDWKTLADDVEAPAAMAVLGLTKADLESLDNSVTITQPGMLSVGLRYEKGSRKICLAGVDLLDADGNIVAHDYYKAESGGTKNVVTYTLCVPKAGNYTLRYLQDTKSDSGRSNCEGYVTISCAEIPSVDLAVGGTGSATWKQADWKVVNEVPAAITDLGFGLSDLRTSTSDYLNITDLTTRGLLSVGLVYSGGGQKLCLAGLELLDANGKVVASDYHKGETGNDHVNNTYTLKAPAAGKYMLRYWCETKTDGNVVSNSTGNISIGLTAIKTINLADNTTATDAWEPDNWVDMADGKVPAGIVGSEVSTGSGTEQVSAANIRSIQQDIVIPAGGGKVSFTFTFTGGGNRLDIAGVDIVDDNGSVVARDYHNGYAGYPNNNNTYSLLVLAEGTYTLRYFYNNRENNTSTGNIAISIDEITTIAMEEDVPSVDSWTPTSWAQATDIPKRVNEVGAYAPYVKVIQRAIVIPVEDGKLSVEFLYSGGNNRIELVGVDILDINGDVIASDYHFGYTGTYKENNVYSMTVPYAGTFILRYFCDNENEANTSTGNINLNYSVDYTLYLAPLETSPIQGVWSRNTTLQAGKTWNISAVVGLIAPGQARRSFLAYSERERAVPWRAFPVYISWYELNIDRNNDENYTGNMTVGQCTEIVNQWKTNLFDKHNANVKSFVWDDGWDKYGTWTFNTNFPNGFDEPNAAAEAMKSNIGCWLGPVGGYGTSGSYRRAYWEGKGGMQLSNPDYYDVFLTACSNMVKDYSFNFFKFDGISAQFSAVGPDKGTTGEENAEAIINIEREVRKLKPDIFLNTTVGTWASPFWFQFTDAVWRQEKDYGTVGDNSLMRENWITYRDQLVYKNFVKNSPLCPINTLMTHGFILTKFSEPAGAGNTDDDYPAILRELRCAFACGSGMVELYNDFSLTNEIRDGALWADIAECIRWQERNADVLPDVHWVGGNPWTGAKAEVYGWASWNGKKATLALRNGANSAQSYSFTLREALDIPDYVNTTIKFSQAFEVQDALQGLDLSRNYNIDEKITVTLPGSSVFVFDGIDNVGSGTIEEGYNLKVSEVGIATLHLPYATTIPSGAKVKYLTAETANPTETAEEGVYTLTYTAISGSTLPKNTPVIVVAEEGDYHFVKTMEEGTPVTGNLLVGSTDGKKPSTAEVLYALGNQDGVVAFYPYAGIAYNTNKAYLDISSLALDANKARRFVFVDDDIVTEIDDIEAIADDEVYTDLSGRRTLRPMKGVYIHRGQKKIITD